MQAPLFNRHSSALGMLTALLLAVPATAEVRLVYDAEPNNAPHQAVTIALPDSRDTLRVLGELDGAEDQDGYRLVVDEDAAGRRFDLKLIGRGGALTRLDVLEFTALADGRGRIPEELTRRPDEILAIGTTEGPRPGRADGLMFAPGVYLLGVSHSGGSGAYELHISARDATRVQVLDAAPPELEPGRVDTRGERALWMPGAEGWFAFELDADDSRAWTLEHQAELGRASTLELIGPDGAALLTLESADGMPVRRSGLMLDEGRYRLRWDAAADGVRRIEFTHGAAPATDGREAEPNDRQPNPIEFGAELAGRTEGADNDTFEFTLDEEQAGQRFDLVLESVAEARYQICINAVEDPMSQCRRNSGGRVQLSDLALVPGRYLVKLSDIERGEQDWLLRWDMGEPARAGEEAEPNDQPEHAGALHERGFGRGRFVGRENDHWRFSVSGEPQLWRLQLQGEGLHEMRLLDAGGSARGAARANGSNRVRLDNQFLLPGEYVLAVNGTDGEYALRIQALGPPPEGMELEPNNEVASATPLEFGMQATGTLAASDDVDLWRFELDGPEWVRITVTPPVDGRIRGDLGRGGEGSSLREIRSAEAELVWQRRLAPGDYVVKLQPAETSFAEYRIRMERLQALEPPADREPNDSPREAGSWPIQGVVDGRVGHVHRDQDWYAIGPLDAPVTLDWPEADGVGFALYALEDLDTDLLTRADDRYAAVLSAGVEYRLHVSGRGQYRIEAPALARLPLDDARVDPGVELSAATDRIQSWSPWRQTVPVRLKLANPAERARELDLRSHLTDGRWSVSGLPERIELAPGGREALEFELTVAPDARDDRPVRLSIAAGDDLGRAVATLEIGGDPRAMPVRPEFHWAVPAPLRGGINAAAARFGAEPVASPNMIAKAMENIGRLFNGLARYGRWTEFRIPTPRRALPEQWGQPTVRLAGDAPVPVRGVLINPTSTYDTGRYLGAFAIELSMDGQSFQRVLSDELTPRAAEQAFVLDAPFEARYARLVPLGSAEGWPGDYGNVALGEFKVVAEPGWRPSDQPLNLASFDHGGHLVRSHPPLHGGGFDQGVLHADGESPTMPIEAGGVEVVLGFEHARAARIGALEIVPRPPAHDGQPLATRVEVSAATDSPSGPWSALAATDLDNGAGRIELDAPEWARYVRLRFDARDESRQMTLPDQIRVIEADGESVLGEWGHLSSAGPWEHDNPPAWRGLDGSPDNDRPENAVALESGQKASGRALLGEYSAHYQLTAPAGNNRLRVTLSGWPTVEARPKLTGPDGEPVDLIPDLVEGDAATRLYQAWVEPGAAYRLEVEEPPRSIIFAWDTSGSVAAWTPTLQRALGAYAGQIQPGRDEVNLLPFGMNQALLENWQGHPLPLKRMLAAGVRLTDSSAAEATLAVAARALVDRPGKKGVVLMTDAATSANGGLWPALDAGRPQVFALKLSSEGAFSSRPEQENDVMQDWARVRGGHFEYVTGFGSLARGYRRAAAWMRRPVDFEVAVEFDQVADPGPATLTLRAPELTPAERGAVGIILDASGSMLKRMDGQRRIEIARDSLRRTVSDILPDGMPVALRVYGHREAGSCRTDLELPLQPLDKSAFLARLEQIQAINLARTPIAASLAAMADDLADAGGSKWVVLLTDGEETCDGDPAAEIEKLRAAGIDARVNIVGFAIDEDALKNRFRDWARLGGGSYFDAGAADSLDRALSDAMRLPFTVLDASGEPRASGQVGGDPLELPAGRYDIRVETSPPRVLEDVVLEPGAERVIDLD